MRRFHKILVGVDLGLSGGRLCDGSEAAVAVALDLSRKTGAEVQLLHSTHGEEHFEHPGGQVWMVRDGVSDAGRQALSGVLDRFVAEGIAVSLAYDDRPAWVALVRQVIEQHVDLLIVGKRANTEMEEDFADGRRLGSVALKLLRKCPCAVWTTPPGAEPRIDRVLAATDLSDTVGSKVTGIGAGLAAAYRAELHVLHAYQLPWTKKLVGDEVERGRRMVQLEGDARRQIRTELEAAGYSGEALLHVTCDSPARAIARTTRELSPSVVVMGTISRTGLRGVLMGNTAERVLGALDCSLLTVKPDGFRSPLGG